MNAPTRIPFPTDEERAALATVTAALPRFNLKELISLLADTHDALAQDIPDDLYDHLADAEDPIAALKDGLTDEYGRPRDFSAEDHAAIAYNIAEDDGVAAWQGEAA